MKKAILELDPDWDVKLVLRHPNKQVILWSSGSPSQEQTPTSEPSCNERDERGLLEDASSISMVSELGKIGPTRGDGTPNEMPLKVSSRHLCLASPIFKRMLHGPWEEAQAHDRTIHANDWNARAFLIVLNIIHGHHGDIPPQINLEILGLIATIVDYYRCHEITKPFVEKWAHAMDVPMEADSGRTTTIMLSVSWVYSFEHIFERMARATFWKYKRTHEISGLVIPVDLYDHIKTRREAYMKELFKGIDDVATALCADESCTLECSAMLLGLMTRRLLQNRLNEKNREAALHAYSLERVCERIRRIARLGWSHPHAFQDDTHGRCTLYRLLGDPLESITTRINNEEFANLCRKRPQVLEESDEEAVAKRLKQDREQEQ